MAKIQLVIFDFDGTLVDTAADLVRSTNLFLESQGLEALSEARIRAAIGMGLRSLILSVYPQAQQADEEFRRKVEADFIALYAKELLTSPQLFPGAQDFLNEWEGHTAIVSNKRERFIHPILEKLGVGGYPWSAIIGGDTFKHMKPHPEPLLAALASANCTPDEVVIVGDGHPDVEGANALGSRCVAVEYGYTSFTELMGLGAWKSIARLDELLPLIRKIT